MDYYTDGPDFFQDLIDSGLLIPVVPCVHGNYARHYDTDSFYEPSWCDGKPVEKEPE